MQRISRAKRILAKQINAAGAQVGALVATTLLGISICAAAPITYNVNQTIGQGDVVGTIQTNGATGVLAAGDLLAWNLTLNGVGASYNLTNASSSILLVGSDLTATALNLFFNFSGADNGYLLFQESLFSGMRYYCDATAADTCLQGASVVPQSIFDPSAQNVPQSGNLVIGTAATATPEPGSIVLLLTGVAGLAASRWRKRGASRSDSY